MKQQHLLDFHQFVPHDSKKNVLHMTSQRATVLVDSMKLANKKFTAMSPEQKRVAIARDVLAQLRSKKYTAERGVYVRTKKNDDSVPAWKSIDLKKAVGNVSCQVCAIGSAYVSALRLFDAVAVSQARYLYEDSVSLGTLMQEAMRPYLSLYFPMSMQKPMEEAFEENRYFSEKRQSYFCFLRLTKALRKKNDEETEARMRLVKIWRIIIEQKGLFEPERYKKLMPGERRTVLNNEVEFD